MALEISVPSRSNAKMVGLMGFSIVITYAYIAVYKQACPLREPSGTPKP